MSDYYDSLEDECDENKCSSDSHKEQVTPSGGFAGTVSENESTENYSFYLSSTVSEEKVKVLPNFQVSKAPKSNSEKKNFLPEIGNGVNETGADSVQSLFADEQILSKQGLQINKDGSFTKSPRQNAEELPFISQKYRNLQFQRKSANEIDKKSSFKKVQKTDTYNLTKKPVDKIKINRIINGRYEKGSVEEMMTSRGSWISVKNHSRMEEQLPPNDNLTDSMKEKLLQGQRESPLKAFRTTSNVEKKKSELNLIKNCETSRVRNKFSRITKVSATTDQLKSVLPKEPFLKNSSSLNSQEKNRKNINSKIFRFHSDNFRNTLRPKLNYSERRMLKYGYNPMYLRPWSKKVQSDTDRSNFGDSVVEEFPGVTHSAPNSGNFATDEDEEIFYRKLIEMDRNQKQQIPLSTRSESCLQSKKLREENGSNSYKNQTEMRRSGKNKFCRKRTLKSISIDIPPEVDCSVNNLQKCSHYCSADFSRNVSKVELALKAKTYGYLANARNIFKLKAQSGKRSVATEKDINSKINDKLYSADKMVDLPQECDKPRRYNSSPLNAFPSVEEGSFRVLEKLPRATKSFFRTKARESEEGFVLPPVNSPKVKRSQKKILQRMSSCLKISNG